jgi:hypothetical protein
LIGRLSPEDQEAILGRGYNHDGTPTIPNKRRELSQSSYALPDSPDAAPPTKRRATRYNRSEFDASSSSSSGGGGGGRHRASHHDDDDDERDAIGDDHLLSEDDNEQVNGDQQEIAKWIDYLQTITGRPRSVVIHALLVNSGMVERAIVYLSNPGSMW